MAGADGLRRLAERAERMERDWPRDGARQVERAVTVTLRSATGDGTLSHDRRGGRAIIRTAAGPGRAAVTAAGSMGVWTIIETGTSPHVVDAGAGKVVRTPFGPRRRVQVSGARGKHVWRDGVARAMPAVRDGARRDFHRMVG